MADVGVGDGSSLSVSSLTGHTKLILGFHKLVASNLLITGRNKFLNFYWPNPSVNELIACVLDPRVKALNFITSQKREEVFDLLKRIYSEMHPEQSSTTNNNPSTTDCEIKSKKIYQPFLMKTIFSKTGARKPETGKV